ncbi:MAG: serine/threonine protein kinase [Armatimonadetes bacterium]|nr:serine/threonine protein kinase [Armatimonadota bacterium]
MLLVWLVCAALPAGAEERWVRVSTDPEDATVLFHHPSLPEGRVEGREVRLGSTVGQVDVVVERPGYLPIRKTLRLVRNRDEVAPGVWAFHEELVPDGIYRYLLHQLSSRPLSAAAAAGALLLCLAGSAGLFRRRLAGARRERAQLVERLEEINPDLTGQRVGGYRVIDLVGEGTFSQVYRAQEEESGRIVALKILKRTCLDPEMIGRMEREAQIGSRLEHPALARLLGSGVHRDLPFLITEYVAGGTLESRLEGEPLSLSESLEWFRQISNGLAQAHRVGIVHRDLKPTNILLSPGGPKVIDFGVAIAPDRKKLTATGNTLGTPLFMAPEQLRGESDRRSDIYALGVLLFRMVTGEYPFRGDDVEQIVTAHLCQPVPSIRDHDPRLPEPLDRVIARMLAKRSSQRYQGLEDVLHDLEPLFRGVAVQ